MSAEAEAVLIALVGFAPGVEIRAKIEPQRFPRCFITGAAGTRAFEGQPYWNVRFERDGKPDDGTSTWWEGAFERVN